MSSEDPSTSNPWNSKAQEKFQTKPKSEFYDPCQEAAAKSIRCLHRNGGDRTMCSDYFQAYRECKKLWVEQRRGVSRTKDAGTSKH